MTNEQHRKSATPDGKRNRSHIDNLILHAGAATGALVDMILGRPGSAEKFQMLVGEVRAAARGLPLRSRSDGSLDLSGLPADARLSVEILGSTVMSYVLGVGDAMGHE